MDVLDLFGERAQSAVEQNSADLLAYFLRRVDVAADAADLLNDTLLVSWRKRAALPHDDAEARMWLFGIARKVMLNYRRSHRRRGELHERLREELAQATQPGTSVAEHLDVRAAITTLDSLDQEIIRLSYWDGFTLAQVARLLRLPEGTVRSRHHRALRRLQERLSLPSASHS